MYKESKNMQVRCGMLVLSLTIRIGTRLTEIDLFWEHRVTFVLHLNIHTFEIELDDIEVGISSYRSTGEPPLATGERQCPLRVD